MSRLNKLGVCLESTKKYPVLDDIGKHFIDRAAELVKSGHKFVYVLDNIDWKEKAHDMRENIQNRSVHAVATSIVFNRVSEQGLPDSGPQQGLKDCNVHQLVDISPLELEAIRSWYKILVAKLLFQHFPAFEMFMPHVPTTTKSNNDKEMSTKSEVLTMPIMMKDEENMQTVSMFWTNLRHGHMKYTQRLGYVSHSQNQQMIPQPQLQRHPDPTSLHLIFHQFSQKMIRCGESRYHALVTSSRGCDLLEQEILEQDVTQPSKGWITCTHFALWTGIQREVS